MGITFVIAGHGAVPAADDVDPRPEETTTNRSKRLFDPDYTHRRFH
jgi:hypothetical protein